MGPEEFTKFDILAWWKERESQFPGIIELNNKTHTEIFGDVYMLEGLLRRSRTYTTLSSLEDRLDNKEQLHDVEVETGNAISLSDEEIALGEAASEAWSSKAEEEDLTLEEALN
ncbi:hypothetical protein Tco_0077254 [Tanacetum coccineum]